MSRIYYYRKSKIDQEAWNVIKLSNELSGRVTPWFAVVSEVLAVADAISTQFALPTKDNSIHTATRTRKQIEINMPLMWEFSRFLSIS